MMFIELRFFVFFAVVFSVYWAMRSHLLRKVWLLATSYAFYAAWDWRFLSLVMFSTFVVYVCAIGIGRAKRSAVRRLWLIAGLIANLAMLGCFRYADYFAPSFVGFSQALGLPIPSSITLYLVLPLGISFFTFQSMSYTIDVFRGELEPRKSILDVALFVAFFPKLIAGPIIRAKEYFAQSDTPRNFINVDVRWCVMLFMVGFLKKACIADNLATYVNAYFADPSLYTTGTAWLASLLWLTQVYCDFSGYSDMAVASAALLGYRLPKNFDFPFFSTDLNAVWRRWNISVSLWFRDYVYIPLGGSRSSALKTIRNILVTLLLVGIWHGASWNFPLWGLVLGMGLVAVMLYRDLRKRFNIPAMPGVVGCPLTLVFMLLTGTLFRMSDFDAWSLVMRQMLLGQSAGPEAFGLHPIYVLALLLLLHVATFRKWFHHWWRKPPAFAFAFLVGVWMAVMVKLLPMGYTPFIYFQF